MFIIYDYRCKECRHQFESMETRGTDSVPCPECAGTADRVISPIRCKLDGASGDFPGEALKWEKRHR